MFYSLTQFSSPVRHGTNKTNYRNSTIKFYDSLLKYLGSRELPNSQKLRFTTLSLHLHTNFALTEAQHFNLRRLKPRLSQGIIDFHSDDWYLIRKKKSAWTGTCFGFFNMIHQVPSPKSVIIIPRYSGSGDFRENEQYSVDLALIHPSFTISTKRILFLLYWIVNLMDGIQNE